MNNEWTGGGWEGALRGTRHTLLEAGHRQESGEHSLVIAVEHAPDTGKRGNGKHAGILHKCCRTARAHEGLAPVQRRIVDGLGAHSRRWNLFFFFLGGGGGEPRLAILSPLLRNRRYS